MFVYQSRFLRRGEVWFDNEPDGGAVDWIVYRNRSRPAPRAKWRHFHNRLIDLSKPSDELLSQMEPKTVAKIDAALQKDKINCEWFQVIDDTQLDPIEIIWNRSIEAQRRWGKLDRAWLREMILARMLEFAVAREPSGDPLVYVGLFVNKQRVQQLLAVSPASTALEPHIRAKTNRASCHLLWSTMLRLKKRGIRCFDFGGWYPGNEDIQLLGANAFKKGFGGEVVREFQCERVVTLRGWVVLTAARLITRTKQNGFQQSMP